MMNEEQLEAASEHLKRINERHEKLQGWRIGVPSESRRQKIRRLRRWKDLPQHYPDKFVRRNDSVFSNFRLVNHQSIDGIELMVTASERVNPTWNWNKSDLLPIEEWGSITQYNGYCRFKRKPAMESGYNGILSYVPVHGGITYCEHKLGVSTYGFDTAHAGDEEDPLVRNVEWVEYQCLVMAKAIKIAALFEPDYLRFKENSVRAMVIDSYLTMVKRKIDAPFVLGNNFGAMINVLFGKL